MGGCGKRSPRAGWHIAGGARPNIRYLFSRSLAAPGPFHPIDRIAGYTIYENSRTLPRFFFASRLQPAASLAEAARILHAADFDPAQTAIVEATARELPSGGLAPGEVELVSYRSAERRVGKDRSLQVEKN